MKPDRKGRKGHSENEFVKGVRFFLFAVITWFVASTASELIGNQANATAFGQVIGRIALAAGVVVVPLILVVWLVLYLRARGSDETVEEVDAGSLPPLEPPAWRRPDPLYDRAYELRRAVHLVLTRSVVAVAGPRDIGTTAVAETVAQTLIDKHNAHPDKTIRFDLRGRSTRAPDDARATAGRILSSFGLDEPADDTAEVLANAARRLIRLFSKHYDTLMLDNLSVPEQVAWLVREWPSGSRQRLILAGEAAISSVVEDGTVLVGELDLPGLRAIWDAELSESEPSRLPRIRDWLKNLRGTDIGETANVEDLLKACFGRPRAVKAFAQEILRPGSTVTVESLLESVRSTGPVDGQLERVWTAILDHIRDGLSAPAVWLLHALAELPVTALTSGAIAAMVARHGVADEDPLEELRIRNLVQETAGRYRMPSEIRRAIVGTTKESERQAVALEAIPALLRHHIEQTDQRAVGLDPAQRWLHDEERSLRPLFGPENYRDERLLALVIEDLPRIADALEAWYVREQQSSGLLTVNSGLFALADRADRPDLAGLAAIRMATAHRMAGRLGEASEKLSIAADLANRLRDKRIAAELDVREHIERALLGMTGTDLDQHVLHQAEIDLGRILATRRGRPQAHGVTTALINLGALCLQQGRPADAFEHLRRAENLANDNRDVGGEAQAIELQGVAVSQGSEELHEAVELWQRAKERFVRIGEEQGEARCLQHLGSAALLDPKVAGQLRDGRPTVLDERAAADVALPLLKRSKLLRAGQPDTTLVDHYLAKARERLELPGEPDQF